MSELRSKTGLRPCPFCGGVNLTMLAFPGSEAKTAWWMLQCECGATGPIADDMEATRTKWDIRADAA